MDNSVAVFNQVLILFLIMFVGFIAKKTGIINDAVSKKLSELLLKITNPLLVLSAFQMDFSPDIMNNVLLVFIFAVVANLVSILLGQVLFVRQKNEIKKIMKFTAVYSNCGFMGFQCLKVCSAGPASCTDPYMSPCSTYSCGQMEWLYSAAVKNSTGIP